MCSILLLLSEGFGLRLLLSINMRRGGGLLEIAEDAYLYCIHQAKENDGLPRIRRRSAPPEVLEHILGGYHGPPASYLLSTIFMTS